MKKVNLILLCISVFSVYVSYKLVTSFYWQSVLLADWTNAELKVRLDVVEKIDSKFPNITVASLPLDAMKMRYYIRSGNFDTLPTLLDHSIKANPYMGVEENIIAQYFYNVGEYDSAYFYANSAFNKIQSNQLHGSVLVSSLIKLDSIKKAISLFDKIEYKVPAHYRLLLASLEEVKDTTYLKKYLEESKSLIGFEDDFKRQIQISKVGYENYYQSRGLEEMASIDYEKGFVSLAVKKFRESTKLNPHNYRSYFNLGIIYFKEFNDSLNLAKKYFYKSAKINPKSGEANYYCGIINYSINNEENKDTICYYLNLSTKLGYNDAKLFSKKIRCIN